MGLEVIAVLCATERKHVVLQLKSTLLDTGYHSYDLSLRNMLTFGVRMLNYLCFWTAASD